MSIDAEKQSLAPSGVVTLWELDATAIGGSLFRFTAQSESDASLVFGGVTYVPVPCRASGFGRTARGQQRRPRIELQDAAKLILAEVRALDGLRGAKLTRIRTFRDHLDDGDDPDPTAVWPPEVYLINRRVSGDARTSLTFELANSLDQAGVMIPAGTAMKGFCNFIYRRYDAGSEAFVVDAHDPCPFTGAAMFDAEGEAVTDPADDVCGKRLTDCKLRFGQTAALPYRGFPGLRRFDI
ncbi:phage minor tail protein L [Minwuia thermotolerans]|uniref:phage minor tail protein L n=1 Tax=Minwuia thermotolerans TaxID=2056226 RepID=UPI0013DDDE50|nr:phage minor tail protein L [Minwuia thermotolerans]